MRCKCQPQCARIGLTLVIIRRFDLRAFATDEEVSPFVREEVYEPSPEHCAENVARHAVEHGRRGNCDAVLSGVGTEKTREQNKSNSRMQMVRIRVETKKRQHLHCNLVHLVRARVACCDSADSLIDWSVMTCKVSNLETGQRDGLTLRTSIVQTSGLYNRTCSVRRHDIRQRISGALSCADIGARWLSGARVQHECCRGRNEGEFSIQQHTEWHIAMTQCETSGRGIEVEVTRAAALGWRRCVSRSDCDRTHAVVG